MVNIIGNANIIIIGYNKTLDNIIDLCNNIIMKENILIEKSKKFAIDIVNLCDSIKSHSSIVNQLIRSGTSIGANIHEAQYAHGKNDFIAKLEISLKECSETEYWLELLFETNKISEVVYKELKQQAGTIRRLLIASCKTAKGNI